MTPFYWVLLFIVVQRLAELALAARNARLLKAEGGVEVGARHYPLFVLLHASWLVALAVLVPADAAIRWHWFAVFVLLQLARVWVILSLGRYWTTRVITVPGRPLVRRGPYRFVRHPNYLVVVLEVAVVPLMVNAWEIALGFSILNLILLRHRIAVEDAALADRR
ncbi:MAG: hypothetical protein MI806_19800 [Minwuiales bacterium]|nr:hypothetical protein [Minwuiales bacterium]